MLLLLSEISVVAAKRTLPFWGWTGIINFSDSIQL